MTPALEAAYAEPHRAYHTGAHIADCLAKLARIEGLGGHQRQLLTWAIWWHDAIYDPARPDNEEASAEMARRDLADMGVGRADLDEVARLILLTMGHTTQPGDRLGALMVGIDLSILGEAPEIYDAYAQAVRREYAHVPEAAFRAGRAGVLRRFLEAPHLFADPDLRIAYEARARENLAREIATLES